MEFPGPGGSSEVRHPEHVAMAAGRQVWYVGDDPQVSIHHPPSLARLLGYTRFSRARDVELLCHGSFPTRCGNSPSKVRNAGSLRIGSRSVSVSRPWTSS